MFQHLYLAIFLGMSLISGVPLWLNGTEWQTDFKIRARLVSIPVRGLRGLS